MSNLYFFTYTCNSKYLQFNTLYSKTTFFIIINLSAFVNSIFLLYFYSLCKNQPRKCEIFQIARKMPEISSPRQTKQGRAGNRHDPVRHRRTHPPQTKKSAASGPETARKMAIKKRFHVSVKPWCAGRDSNSRPSDS